MFIDTSRGDRSILTDAQQIFLRDVLHLATYITNQIYDKCLTMDPPKWTAFGIFPSVMAAHIIFKSDWGTHPVSQARYSYSNEEKMYISANNLSLIKSDSSWRRPTLIHENVIYKSFKDRLEFAIHMTDIFAWTDAYNFVLMEDKHKNQITQLAKCSGEDVKYTSSVADLILKYKLFEYD